MDGRLLIVLAVAGLAAWQAAVVAWWPWAPCRRCGTTGTRPQAGTHFWRTCPRCKGSGRRLRLGRVLLNALSATAREATTAEADPPPR